MDNSRQTGHETNCNKLNRRSSTYTNTYRWENGPTIAFLFIFEFIFLNKQNPTNNTLMLYRTTFWTYRNRICTCIYPGTFRHDYPRQKMSLNNHNYGCALGFIDHRQRKQYTRAENNMINIVFFLNR